MSVAIVTGASRGIGRATALLLAENGFDIAFNHLGDHARAREVGAAIEALGRSTFHAEADMADPAAIRAFAAAAQVALGPPDVMSLATTSRPITPPSAPLNHRIVCARFSRGATRSGLRASNSAARTVTATRSAARSTMIARTIIATGRSGPPPPSACPAMKPAIAATHVMAPMAPPPICNGSGTRVRRSVSIGSPSSCVIEHLLDFHVEQPRNAEGEWQRGIVLASLDRIHGLARYVEPKSELGLAPVAFGAQNFQTVFHVSPA